jgi:putative phosphoribosyl transferase
MLTEQVRDEGERLARTLVSVRDERPFVLAIPRGGVLLGDVIARELKAPLDVVLATKLATGPLGVAFGAIAEGGAQVIDERTVAATGLTPREIEALVDLERGAQDQLRAQMRGVWPLAPIAGRAVVLVDDAVITGLTMRAAIAAVRARGARRVIVATPLCAHDAAARLVEAHEVMCLEACASDVAARRHDAPHARLAAEQVHDVIERELHDVGADLFGHLELDGMA